MSIFSHNPLVPGSSPGGPTNSEKATDFLASGFFAMKAKKLTCQSDLVMISIGVQADEFLCQCVGGSI